MKPALRPAPRPLVSVRTEETEQISPSEAARRRFVALEGEPAFTSDWDRAVFLHYEVAPEALQPYVPFPLDLRDGRAYVSLVAFTMRDLRPRRGGRLASLLFRPIATHPFLNVRTYVRWKGEPGIYFLAEWLPNRLSVLLGPPVFGLPYRLGRLDYRHRHERRDVSGSVVACDVPGARLSYRLALSPDLEFRPSAPGSLDEFLLERYTAFTYWRGLRRLFRIWHPPWQQCPAGALVRASSLALATGDWFRSARFVGAHVSIGAPAVWMGPPRLPLLKPPPRLPRRMTVGAVASSVQGRS